jgi:hypothetical protein
MFADRQLRSACRKTMHMSEDDNNGYKKPRASAQFKTGQSGNPKGRPKGSRNLKTDLAAISQRSISVRENGKTRHMSQQKAMLLSAYNKAIKGDQRAASNLINLTLRILESAEPIRTSTEVPDGDALIVENYLRRCSNPTEE